MDGRYSNLRGGHTSALQRAAFPSNSRSRLFVVGTFSCVVSNEWLHFLSASGAELFNGGELSLSALGNYVDKDDSKIAPGAGVSYFLTRHLVRILIHSSVPNTSR